MHHSLARALHPLPTIPRLSSAAAGGLVAKIHYHNQSLFEQHFHFQLPGFKFIKKNNLRPSKKKYMFSVRILKKKEDEGHFIFYLLFFKTARHFLIIFQDGRHKKKWNTFSVWILKKGGAFLFFIFFQDGRHFKIIFQDGCHFRLASIPEVYPWYETSKIKRH